MRRSTGFTVLLLCSLSALGAAAPKARVSLELLTRPGLPLTASQQWYKALTEVGIDNLQIRSGGGSEQPSLSEQGSKAAPQYKVIGIVAADNSLHLPGGKFKLNEGGRLRKWLDNLGDLGGEGVTAPRSAFGLVPRQLEQVHDDLSKPVTVSTQGASAGKLVAQLGSRLEFPLAIDEAAKRELADLAVADEFKGLSTGTALAVILRPAGLVLVPERPPGGEIAYHIGKAVVGRESWPIGWKPKDKPNKVVPELFEFLNAEIKDVPVSEALEAIQGRLKIPFLFDRNAFALHGVDLAKTDADVPNKRLTYSLILGKVLMQGHAKYELRVDESEQPFLWITTVKPAP